MERKTSTKTINNAFYDDLGDDWYTSCNHPIALLRAENKIRIPWILSEINKKFGNANILDIGCGAGMLTNALSQAGHCVFGIDLSESSLAIAKKRDPTGLVMYQKANAYALPFPDSSFEIVCATDVLEHVEMPQKLIAEASRVLKPGGLFFFHTFNRNFFSYLLVIKGVEWCVPNAPPRMHVYPLFIKPKELSAFCKNSSMEIESLIGLRPCFSLGLWKMIFQRKISDYFSFQFTKNLLTGYCGIACKSGSLGRS